MLRAGIEGLCGYSTLAIGSQIAYKAVSCHGIKRPVGIYLGMSLLGMGSTTVYKVLKTFSPLSTSDLLVIGAVGVAFPVLTKIYLNGRVASNNGQAHGKYKVVLVGAAILLGLYVLHRIFAQSVPEALPALEPLELEAKAACKEVLQNGFGGVPGLDLKKHVRDITDIASGKKIWEVWLTKEGDKLVKTDRIYDWRHIFKNSSLSISIMGGDRNNKQSWCSPMIVSAEKIKESCEDILKQGFGLLPGMDLKRLVSTVIAGFDHPPHCNVQLSTEGKDIFNRSGNFWSHFFTFVVSNSCIVQGKIQGS